MPLPKGGPPHSPHRSGLHQATSWRDAFGSNAGQKLPRQAGGAKRTLTRKDRQQGLTRSKRVATSRAITGGLIERANQITPVTSPLTYIQPGTMNHVTVTNAQATHVHAAADHGIVATDPCPFEGDINKLPMIRK